MDEIVESLSVAKVGDFVWHFDSQRNRYTDGKYQGRGVWTKKQIDSETRRSFSVYHTKFDRFTGAGMKRGDYTTGDKIAGRQEYRDSFWIESRHIIGKFVDGASIEKLKAVAEIFGFVPEEGGDTNG